MFVFVGVFEWVEVEVVSVDGLNVVSTSPSVCYFDDVSVLCTWVVSVVCCILDDFV